MNSEDNSQTVLVAYVPTPHAGYLKFFRKYEGADLYVLGTDYVEEFPELTRHLPGNKPSDVATMVRSLNIFRRVNVLRDTFKNSVLFSSEPPKLVVEHPARVVMPDEDVSRAVAAKYISAPSIEFDDCWKLRWDRAAVAKALSPEDETHVSFEEFDRDFMRQAFSKATRSPDWWRQVGALLVRDGESLFAAFNEHLPSEQSAYCYGDPRSNFGPGESIDMSLALHAEIAVIAEAARRGIKPQECDLYVTTFPCPPCARAIAKAGFKRLYYAEGYSLIEGAEALRSRGVEIVRVEMDQKPSP
jgi:dCMP deaminase